MRVVADRPDAQLCMAGDAGFLHDLHDMGAKSKLRRTDVASE